jgi:pyruvate/2-oxoglutarate dehydrogenase complex dihydrolipoamide dehydrogenase (E3) component
MGPSSSYDVVVVGTGSGGKIAAIELARLGRSVLAVEDGRFGGECPYVACVPSKSLLVSARHGLTWPEALACRDEATAGRDDSGSLRSLTDEGVAVLRGHGRLVAASAGRHRVVVTRADDEESVDAPVVVLGTGGSPVRPPIEGLDGVSAWTSDEALSAMDRPDRLVILGGGATGCELAQAFSLFGTAVTVVEEADRLLPGENEWVGGIVADALRDFGVTVLTGTSARRAQAVDAGRALRLAVDGPVDGAEDGPDEIEADRLLLAGGRSPNTSGIGLEEVGAALEESGAIAVDARCQVLDGAGEPIAGLYAVGDVTDGSAFTHSANYQARVVAADVAGHGYDADLVAVPRAVYVEPAVFCVGLTSEQAQKRGTVVVTAGFDVGEVERAALLAQVLARRPDPAYAHRIRGRVELVADAHTGTLLGAACVGPEADSWGAELALAVRAQLDVRLLAQHIRAFPTWSEAIYPAARELVERLGRPQ